MTDKEKIRAEIEKQIAEYKEQHKALGGAYYCGKFAALEDLLPFIDSLQEEPVNEDLEKAAVEAFKQIVDSDKNNFLEIFKAGAKWQKTKDESTTEDLGEYTNELSKQFPEVSFAKLSRIAVRVAKWQMAQMVKDATDVTVHVDAGGYPYIPQMELYDYDKDIPLAKEGDKYNVVLIKED